MNNGSTAWCEPQEPRLSSDGTTEYLHGIFDPRVTLIEQPSWSSKDEMANVALCEISEPCVLMQIDSDEIWRAEQLDGVVQLFNDLPDLSSIMFACDYYVGGDLILKGEYCYGDYDYEWLRAWRFNTRMRFASHEPPVLTGDCGKRIYKRESIKLFGKFSHYAYATEAQVRYKEQFYGYKGIVEQWRQLQKCNDFPVSLAQFFSHVPQQELPLVMKV